MTWSQNGQWPGDLGPRMRAAMHAGGHKVGKELQMRAKQGILNGSKSGRVYRHPNGGTYTASKFGEYSANVTGRLLNSINYNVSGAQYIRFYATAPHAGYQEYGTRKMDPRENLKRAIRESDAIILRLLEDIIWRAIG